MEYYGRGNYLNFHEILKYFYLHALPKYHDISCSYMINPQRETRKKNAVSFILESLGKSIKEAKNSAKCQNVLRQNNFLPALRGSKTDLTLFHK